MIKLYTVQPISEPVRAGQVGVQRKVLHLKILLILVVVNKKASKKYYRCTTLIFDCAKVFPWNTELRVWGEDLFQNKLLSNKSDI